MNKCYLPSFVIQDVDYGRLSSARMPTDSDNAPVDSFGSSTQWTDDLPIPGPYSYHIPDV
jgi:hypothetical protein